MDRGLDSIGIIYIGSRFLSSREGERPQQTSETLHKSPFIVTLNMHHAVCSLDVDINAVSTTVSNKGLERRYILGKRDRIVCSLSSRLTIFAALQRRMDRGNAKLGEGVKRLFYGLLYSRVSQWKA